MVKIGVLGGIGPEATGIFYSRLVKELQASRIIEKNTDFPQIIINSIPAPELLSLKPSKKELAPYFQGLKELDSLKPDFIIMACNTIHVFRNLLQRRTSSEIIDLRKEAKNFLASKKINKICVLGTPLTLNSRLFEFDGFKTIRPDRKEQAIISKAIFHYNKGVEKRKQVKSLEKIARKHSKNAVLLLACTEISLMLKGLNCRKIDTMDVMINAVLKRL